MRKRTALALAVVLVLAVGCGRQSAPGILGCAGLSRTVEPPADAKNAETFIREILLAQYSRPVRSDARAKLPQAYSTSHEEVSRERTRVLNDLTNDQKAMESRKAAYRDSKVRIRFRSLEANGNEIYGVVEVLADWHWGDDGNPLETPTQVYNLHEFRLTRTGGQWQVILDRNLASNPKTQVQVSPLPWSD